MAVHIQNDRLLKFALLVTCVLFSTIFSVSGALIRSEMDATTTSTSKSTDSMKAIVYQEGAQSLKLVTKNHPKAGRRGRVLVQVHFAGLNPVDAKDVMGDKLPHTWTWARSKVRNHLKGKIVGFDFSGSVQEDIADRFQIGDKVFGNMPPFEGTLAEYISVPLDQICHAPSSETCSLSQAAAMPLVGLTALQSLSPCMKTKKATTGSGDDDDDDQNNNRKSVLVLGASGGTGHVGLQMARNLGALHVTAVCSGKREAFVESCGATHVVDYTLDSSNPDTLYTNLKKAPGYPFQVVLDCVTSADPNDRQLDYPSLVRRGGKTAASRSNDDRDPLVTDDHKYLRLGGPSPDWIRAALEKAGLSESWIWPDKHEKLFWIRFPKSSHELKQLQEWAQDGKLQVQVSETVPFTPKGVQDAFDRILSRRVQGKIVVDIATSEEAK